MTATPQILQHDQLDQFDPSHVIAELAAMIAEQWLVDPERDIMVGIHTGGVQIATQIHQILSEQAGLRTPLSRLDINLYRDDFDQQGIVHGLPNDLPEDLNGRRLLLIDDVIYSGRSIRAALNILFDYGRPQSVQLAVLLDRGGRELPIEPNYTGIQTTLPANQRIKIAPELPHILYLKNEPAPNRDR